MTFSLSSAQTSYFAMAQANSFQKKTRDERIRFVLDTAKMMKDDPNSTDLLYGNEAELTRWISELVQEVQSSS